MNGEQQQQQQQIRRRTLFRIGFVAAILWSANNSSQTTFYYGSSTSGRFLFHDRALKFTKNRTKARYLVGFFSYGILDNENSNTIATREQHRRYFEMIADPRICPLYWFLDDEDAPNAKTISTPKNDTSLCQFIYTFVAGFDNATLPTELLPSDRDNMTSMDNRDAYYEHIRSHPQDSDVTILNIQENMNEGKSQTWFKYASRIMDRYDFDYAIKADTDTYILSDLFFDFADKYLPMGGQRIYAGKLRDKAFWGGSRFAKDAPSLVHHMRSRDMVQIYMIGPFYILSKDLAKWVSSKSFFREKWYEKIEDHDVGMRVFDFPEPIHAIWIQTSQLLWVHPVKTRVVWELVMNRLSWRMNGTNIFPEPDAQPGPRIREALRVFNRPKRGSP
jgi:hypothetical protein